MFMFMSVMYVWCVQVRVQCVDVCYDMRVYCVCMYALCVMSVSMYAMYVMYVMLRTYACSVCMYVRASCIYLWYVS